MNGGGYLLNGNYNTIRIPIKKWFHLLLLFVCVPGGVLFLYFSIFSNDLDEEVKDVGKRNIFTLLLQLAPTSLVLFVMAILCLVFSVVLIKRLMLGNSAIVLSREGIDVKISVRKTGLINWSDIKDIKMDSYNKQRVFTINLFNPEILIQRQNKFNQLYDRYLNKKSQYDDPVVFSPKSVKMKEQDLYLLMLNYHNQYKYKL